MAKERVERCLRLSIGAIRQDLVGQPTIVRWYRGEHEIAVVGMTLGADGLQLRYSANDVPQAYTVPLTSTPVYRAHQARRWFRCPSCLVRCGTLYLPPGGRIFACRRCYDLAYEGQQDRTYRRNFLKAMAGFSVGRKLIAEVLGGGDALDAPCTPPPPVEPPRRPRGRPRTKRRYTRRVPLAP
jgi:hypothetical protein